MHSSLTLTTVIPSVECTPALPTWRLFHGVYSTFWVYILKRFWSDSLL